MCGAHVLVNSRSEARAARVVGRMVSEGLSAAPAVFDVRNGLEVDSYVAEGLPNGLHTVVSNAYAGAGGTVETASEDEYLEAWGMSVLSTHRIFRSTLSHLRRSVQERGDASFVVVASMYGMVSPDRRIYGSAAEANPPFYGASKAGMIQWARYAACEFGPEGIRVNAVSPGPFPNESVQLSKPEFVDRLVDRVPLRRIGAPEEIAWPIAFLASKASSFISGSNLTVDGGWTAW